mgnify:CR=1 FL=1
MIKHNGLFVVCVFLGFIFSASTAISCGGGGGTAITTEATIITVGATTSQWPVLCDNKIKVLTELENKYGEKLRWEGMVQAIKNDGTELKLVAQLFVSPNGWSFVMGPPQADMVCVVASGKGGSHFLKKPGLSVQRLGGGTFGYTH